MNREPLPSTTEFIFICQLLHVCVFVAATPLCNTNTQTHPQAGYWRMAQVLLQLDSKTIDTQLLLCVFMYK